MYLKREAGVTTKKTEKFLDFINEAIRINDKSTAIVEIWGKHVDLETIRVNELRKILSDDCLGKSRNYDIGALSLARFIDVNLREIYKQSKEVPKYKKALKLFSVLLEKTRFTRENHRLMSARLLDLVDFGRANFTHIMEQEKELCDLIAKECGIKEVSESLECLKDVKESEERNNQVKNAVSDFLTPRGQKNVLGQVLTRKAVSNWMDRCSFQMPDIPLPILNTKEAIEHHFKTQSKSLRFDLAEGKSILAAEYGKRKYRFEFRNLYVMALLQLDGRPSMMWGEFKRAMVPMGQDKQKTKGILDLLKTLMELVHSGLVHCSLKILQDPSLLSSLPDSTEFALNPDYDFRIEEHRRVKRSLES